MSAASAPSNEGDQRDGRRARGALQVLNFFMADMQAGIGPFLGVFLQQRGWAAGPIGLVMTLGGVAGMAVTAPAGALIDATRHKRSCVIVSGVCTVLASALIWVNQDFWTIAASQVATAIAGAAIVPAVAGITLGVVRQRGFNRQNGRNQAFNHAGNMVGAGLSGLLGWKLGFAAVFWLAVGFAVASVLAVLAIPRRTIDHRAARGLEGAAQDGDGGTGMAGGAADAGCTALATDAVHAPAGGAAAPAGRVPSPADGSGAAATADAPQVQGWRVLLASKPLLVLAACLALFHLGNGAMLPLYGLAVVAAHKGNPAGFVAMTIVVAQAVMVVASLAGMRLAERRGYWLVLLITFIALPVRGLVAASVIEHWGVWPVQMLDGIGAGLQSVAVPGLVARILSGTGRVNVGQGAVMTVQAAGAALSPAIGGALADAIGYPAAFLVLGSFSLGSLAIWLRYAALMRPACAPREDGGRRLGGPAAVAAAAA